jgi:hypothetical protein
MTMKLQLLRIGLALTGIIFYCAALWSPDYSHKGYSCYQAAATAFMLVYVLTPRPPTIPPKI